MNVSVLGKSMGTKAAYEMKSLYMGKLSLLSGMGLKSEQEKMQRRQKTDEEISFWEGRKESLKNMKCNGIEDIAKKLDMFHNYEEEIAAAKAAYNREQMFHVLDEAEEIGKKIADAVEKTDPKPQDAIPETMDEALAEETQKLEEPAEQPPEEYALQNGSISLRKEEELKALYRPLDIRI